MVRPSRWVLLALAFALPRAYGQEFGLDLTDAADYRPKLGIIGAASVDPSVSSAVWEKLRMDRISGALEGWAQKADAFSRVSSSTDAFGALGENYGEALKCSSADCFGPIAVQLDAQVLVSGQLGSSAGHPVLRLLTYLRYKKQVDVVEVSAQRGPATFEKEVTAAFTAAVKKAATATGPLGLLKLKSATPNATAALGEHLLGPMSGERLVPPGNWVLQVAASGHLSDEVDLTLGAGETKEIEANLVEKPAEAPPPVVTPVVEIPAPAPLPPSPSAWKRPGLYVAVVGLLTAGAGAYLGSRAKSVEAKAKDEDGDGVLDITRSQALGARQDAMLANVLVGAGGALLAGGAAWFFLAPAPPVEGSGGGVTVGIGGVLP